MKALTNRELVELLQKNIELDSDFGNKTALVLSGKDDRYTMSEICDIVTLIDNEKALNCKWFNSKDVSDNLVNIEKNR